MEINIKPWTEEGILLEEKLNEKKNKKEEGEGDDEEDI